MKKIDLSTLAVHAGETPDPQTGAMRTPIDMASTFKLPKFGPALVDALLLESPHPAHVYTRWSNPTLRALEERLLALETAALPEKERRGVDALVTASGQAAVAAMILTLLKKGDHLVASEICYAGSVELFGQYLPGLGIEVNLVNMSEPEEVQAALRPNTRLIYAETPANPVLRLADLAALAGIAHAAGMPLAVDSTFASPALQQPLALGADIVIHSLTKYICGHGDALGGVVIGPVKIVQKIRKEMLLHLGGALSPFNAWLIQRGAVTLPLRMRQHCESAQRVAEFLEGHPRVQRVVYPGLASHPHHELALRQMSAPGAMMTIQLKGGLGAVISLSEKISVFHYATSLGHAHSLLFYYPADTLVDEVPYLTAAQKAGIREWTGDGIIRASIGLESAEDLIADLDQGLRGRTLRGAAGPLAYKLFKKSSGKKKG